MRILHLDTDPGWRGGQRQLLLLSVAQRAAGLRPVVGCRRDGRLEAALRARSVEVLPLPGRRPFWDRQLWRLARDSDVIHAHTSHAHDLGWGLSRATGCPLVVSRRVDFPPGRLSLAKYRAPRRLICVSRAVAQVLSQRGVPDERLAVVHEAVPALPLCPAATGGERLVLWIGALVAHKDPLTMVDAWAWARSRLAGWHLRMLGAGPLEAQVRQRVRALGLEPDILAGQVRHPRRFLRKAALLVATSVEEGLNTSVLDAARAGRPALVTAAGGLPEAVVEGQTGWVVPPRSPAAMADALHRACAAPSERLSRGRAARQRAASVFSIESMCTATQQIYSEILAKK